MATQALTDPSIANTPKKETVAETFARGKAVLASDPAGINKPKSVTPVSTKDVSTIITSDQLEGAAGNDIKLPEQPKTQTFDTGVTPETVAADQQTELQRLQEEQEKQKADVKTAFDEQGGMGEFEGQISDAVGLQKKREEKTKYDNKVLAKQREQDLAIRDAQDAFGTRAQKNAIISEITKNTNRELADLSIIQMAKAGEFNDAQAYVNRKVELEFADRKANLDGLKFLYEENKDRLTLVEQRDFNKTILEEQRAFDEAKEKSTQLENMKLQMQINATEAGAGDAVKQAIQSAEDTEALLAVPGVSEYMKSYEEKLAIKAQEASIAQSWQSVASNKISAQLDQAQLDAYNKAQKDAEEGILTGEQVGTAQTINKDFEDEPIVKAYNEALTKSIVLEDTLENGIDGIQDLQLVYEFMKAVDPTSVVRESEFAMAAGSGNIFAGAFTRFNKGYFGAGGFLPEDVKADFTRAARASFNANSTQYYNVKNEKAKQINQRLGINNGADYLTAYESAAPLQQVDFDLADSLTGATEQDLLDIMAMQNELLATPSGQTGR